MAPTASPPQPPSSASFSLTAYARLARPADWTKNLFVFPALLASGKYDQPEAIAAAIVAFFAFSFTAGGIYSINDALDWREDRLHPVKRTRPIASGEISPTGGKTVGLLWIVAGFVAAALTGVWELLIILGGYIALQTVYNLALKRIVMVDVTVLALGFVLRAWAGAVAIEAPASLWLLGSVFFLCLYLAEIKRLCDMASVSGRSSGVGGRGSGVGGGGSAASTSDLCGSGFANPEPPSGSPSSHASWRPAAGYRGIEELNWMLAVSAAAAILTFLMYSLSDHSAETAGPGARGLALLTPLVVLAMFRFYHAALRGHSDSPLRIVIRDPIVLISSILFAAGATIFLTVEPIGRVVGHYFGL